MEMDLKEAVQRGMQLAFEVFNAERLPAAEALCRMVLQLEPKEPQALFLLGMVLHRTQRDQEAIKWLQAAVEADPAETRCHHGLGLAYYTLKQYRPAIDCFTRCLELKPEQRTFITPWGMRVTG